MTYNAWTTQLSLWREASVLGSKTGLALRPPGITSLELTRETVSGYSTTDPHGAQSEGKVIHAAWTLTIQKEFSFGPWLDLMLEALRTEAASVTSSGGFTTTARITRADAVTPTFACDFIAADGTARRLRGMTPRKIEWTIEAGRIISETIELGVLATNALAPASFTPLDVVQTHSPATAINCRHAITTSPAWTGGDAPAPGDYVPSFASQIILDREIEAVQFSEEGSPTRWQVNTAWRAAGASTIKLSTAQAAALAYTTAPAPGIQLWTITKDLTLCTLEIPRCRFNLRTQHLLGNGFLDHGLEWIATGQGFPILKTTTVAAS